MTVEMSLKPIADPDSYDAIRYAVCGYCANISRQICIEDCVPEGLYRCLEPVPLEEWDNPPELPNMDELLGHEAITRLALLKLAIHYLREDAVRTRRPLYEW